MFLVVIEFAVKLKLLHRSVHIGPTFFEEIDKVKHGFRYEPHEEHRLELLAPLLGNVSLEDHSAAILNVLSIFLRTRAA